MSSSPRQQRNSLDTSSGCTATIGFGAEHFSASKPLLNDTILARTLTISPTTYGPLLGIGIYF